MGFGHAVYRNFDPRAKIIGKACEDVLKKLGIKDPLLDIAKKLEQAALKDDYFLSRKLYPNVDFYSGIIMRALGHPDEHVHGHLRDRPDARLDRQLARGGGEPQGPDLPAAADLRRAGEEGLRPDGRSAA